MSYKSSEYYDVYDKQNIHIDFVVKNDLFLSDEERDRIEKEILNVVQEVYKDDVDNIELSDKKYDDRLPLHVKSDEIQEIDLYADVDGRGQTYYDSYGFEDGVYDEYSSVRADHYIMDDKAEKLFDAMKSNAVLSNVVDYVDSVNIEELPGWEK